LPAVIKALRITDRQHDVLHWLAEGKTNDEIATQLGISTHTAKFHINALMALFEVNSRTSIVVLGLKMGHLKLDELMTDWTPPEVPADVVTF
jgi:DNA-binding CsgD family transcriptional regulator